MRLDNGQTRWLSHSALPYNDSTFTSTSTSFAGWPNGHLRVTAFVNGIPSASKIVPMLGDPESSLVSLWLGENNALDIFGSNHGMLQSGATFGVGKYGRLSALTE